MNYSEFIQNIKANQVSPVYLFTGDEEYLMNEAIDRLKSKYVGESFEDLNFFTINKKDITFDEILNPCETLPFMSEKKMVLVKDIVEIIENNQALDEQLADYVSKLDDYLLLILRDKDNSLKKTTKLYKALNKMNSVVEFAKLKGTDLNNWIHNLLKSSGKSMNASTLNYFLQQSTYGEYGSIKTLYDLQNELIKVINYSNKDEITTAEIDLVLTKNLDTNVFNLLGCITKKDSHGALKIFNEMYLSNEPVQKVVFMLIRQLRLMLGYKLYREKGYMDNNIQEKLQIKPYEFKKISKESGNFTEKQLMLALEKILELDIKQKTTSQDDKLAFEILIINLIHNI